MMRVFFGTLALALVSGSGYAVTSDVTFYCANDMHFGCGLVGTRLVNTNHQEVINNMNSLPGNAYPAAIGGTVDVARAVIVSGDLTEAGAAVNWGEFTNAYGLSGVEGDLHYPVCEGWGNHDNNTTVKSGIAARNPLRTFLPNLSISTNGYHYSWDWDNVHFVMLNKYPGTTESSSTTPEYSFDFLVSDLRDRVGASGRPVVIMQHYGVNAFGLTWWSAQDQTNFLNTIVNYNVVGIIHGHSHSEQIYKWNGFDVFNAQAASGKEVIDPGFMVGHITSNELTIACRIFDTTTLTWNWTDTFKKTIANVLPPAQLNNGAGASSIAATAATLNGELFATNAAPTSVFICWGTTDAGTNAGSWGKIENLGERPLGAFSLNLTNLAADTAYYYRSYASNSIGTVWSGAAMSFRTRPWIAVSNGAGVTGLTTNSATVNGMLVETNAASNAVYIYWGTADGGTNKGAWSNIVAFTQGNVGSFSTNLTGLNSLNTYYYRCYGSNSMGDAWAPESLSFQPYESFSGLAIGKQLLVELVADHGVTTNASGEAAVWLNLGAAGGSFTNAYLSTLPSLTTISGTRCLSFDGVDDALESTFLSPDGITGTNDWTVELWAYNPSILSNREFMLSWSHMNTSLKGAAFSYGNMRAGAVEHGTGWDTAFAHYVDHGEVFAGGAPVAGSWHHIAYTFSNTLLSIYVDGVLNTSYNFNLDLYNTQKIYLGGAIRNDTRLDPYYNQFSGALAAVRIHAGGLTSRQIANNFMGGPLAASTNLAVESVTTVDNGSGASGVTLGGATLNGTLVSTSASPTFVSIFWGTGDGGTNQGAWTGTISMGQMSPGAFSTNLVGLASETTYYYRCYASNGVTSVWANVAASFSTASVGGGDGKTYAWDNGAGTTNWNDPVNWSNITDSVNDKGFPNGAGSVAYQFAAGGPIGNVPGMRLNQDITVGRIVLGKSIGDNATFLSGSPVGKFIFNNLGSEALLEYTKNGIEQLTLVVNPNIELSDDLLIYVFSDRNGNAFNGVISDAAGETHKLRIRARAKTANTTGYVKLNNANSYKGGTVVVSAGGTVGRVIAAANGAFGAGDVTVETNAMLYLNDIGTSDNMINDNAGLYLQSSGGNYAAVGLASNVNETIGRLFFNGVPQVPGTWGSSSSTASNRNDAYFSGIGVLVVTGSGWATIQAGSGAHGAIAPSGAVQVVYGSNQTFTITADAHYHVATVEVDGQPQGAPSTYSFETVTTDRTIQVWFAQNLATNGTPEEWLATHGFTNREWDVEALDDQDRDGLSTWQEWLADTDPTNAASKLTLSEIRNENGQMRLRWKGGLYSTQYVERATVLDGSSWESIFTNIPPTSSETNLLDVVGTNQSHYFRIRVRR